MDKKKKDDAFIQYMRENFKDLDKYKNIHVKDNQSFKDYDPVNSPPHYQTLNTKFNIECIDAMRAAFGDDEVSSFCKLNAFKYIWRCSSKGELEDLQKAEWYLNKYIELNKD